MNKNRTSPVGFLTIVTVFLIISLVTLGALSLIATGKGSAFSDKTEEYMKSYRAAWEESQKRLAMTDGCIVKAASTGLFDMNFPVLMEELDFAEVSFDGKLFTVRCETPINERTSLFWEITADPFPADRRGGYTVTASGTVSSDSIVQDDEYLNVWLG